MLTSALESVTAGVRDMAAALAFFRKRPGLEVVSDTRASVGLLGAWRRPVHEAVRLVELALRGEPGPRLRLAEYETGAAAVTTKTGPRAFVFRAKADDMLDGPDGIAIALRRDPRASVIVAADDLDAAARFHVDALGWPSAEAGGISLIEGAGSERPPAPGHLGLSHLTCRCEELDDLLTRVEALGLEPITRPTHVGLPGGRPGRVMLVLAPGNILYELYELAA
jgi:catechol 2,3-dioxygenase-like lactoylglutathione lyase family enzyme